MISVVIPVYNHARYVRASILSALRCRIVSEILVADDGSSDGSADIVAAMAATHPRVVDLSASPRGNVGAHERLNRLIAAATNEWIAVLNSDDLFPAGRFDSLHLAIRRRAADFFFGDILIINGDGAVIGEKRSYLYPEYPFPAESGQGVREWRPLLFHQNFIATTSNMVFTKSLHARIGGFSARRYCHDWEFALRALFLGTCVYQPQYLTIYRIHGTNTISEGKSRIADEVKIMFKAVLADFPNACDDPKVALHLTHNQYLH